MTDTARAIRAILGRLTGLPQEEFRQDTLLLEDGLLSSIQVVSLAGELEEAFGVRLEGEDVTAATFRTPADIGRLVERLLPRQAAPR